MIETVAFQKPEAADIPDQYRSNEPNAQEQVLYHIPGSSYLPLQVLRFALAGGLNTLVDLVILNVLLWLFPTTSTLTLLAYNSLAYSLGAINSFLINKHWTFASRQKATREELTHFTLITLCGVGWSSAILLLASTLLHPFLVNTTLWANASKLVAIGGTALISYLGMRLWVFVSRTPKTPAQLQRAASGSGTVRDAHGSLPAWMSREATGERQQHSMIEHQNEHESLHSLSVVLPTFNEEQVIASTVVDVLDVLNPWCLDVEVLVVDDGSTHRTGAIVAALAETHPQLHCITHPSNQGYGAALASGFAAATKDLTLFMDADGQFDIHDLQRFFPFIDEYDAVIGYRLHRQDTWVRKLNAWGWKHLIGWVLGVRVRDIDCAFKLYRTAFLHQYPPQTQGAMINAELLYRLKRAGYSYREVGVHHLPRRGGRASGANLRVIARAFRELFIFAHQWRHEERVHAKPLLVSEHQPYQKGPLAQ